MTRKIAIAINGFTQSHHVLTVCDYSLYNALRPAKSTTCLQQGIFHHSALSNSSHGLSHCGLSFSSFFGIRQILMTCTFGSCLEMNFAFSPWVKPLGSGSVATSGCAAADVRRMLQWASHLVPWEVRHLTSESAIRCHKYWAPHKVPQECYYSY